MEDQVICPRCGHPLGEPIPQALVGSIKVKCLVCEMVYSFRRGKDEDTLEEEGESYLSTGPFRRKIVFSDGVEPHEGDSSTRVLLCVALCIFGPMFFFFIYWVISYLLRLFV